MSNYRPRASLPRVMPDFVEAGRLVATHFLQNKFRHILFLGGVRETKLENTIYRGLAGVLAKRTPTTYRQKHQAD